MLAELFYGSEDFVGGLDPPVALLAFHNYRTCCDVERSEQRACFDTGIGLDSPAGDTARYLQNRSLVVQCQYLRFLVHAEHNGSVW